MDFVGKVVLITGGAGGTGQAIARKFLEKRAKVSICDINEAAGKRVLGELQKDFGVKNVIFSKCDVTKDEDFERAYEECKIFLGEIDILINTAAVITRDLRTTIKVTQLGTMIGTEIAMKRMGKHHGGNGGFVVNIASTLGINPGSMFPFYGAAKAAVVQYSRIIGNEFHRNYSGVSVLCLCPGPIDAPLLSHDLGKKTAYNKYVEKLIDQFHSGPIHKLEASEVGDAVIKLISENKSGEIAVIDKEEGFFYVPPSIEKIYVK